MENCNNCLFMRISKDKRYGSKTYDCSYEFIILGNYDKNKSTNLDKTCSNFLLNTKDSIQKLFEEFPEKWFSFGTDKRTAHYKDTKDIIDEGGDKYLPIWYYVEEFYNTTFDFSQYEFPYHLAIVHYENGDFRKKQFRVDIKAFPNFKRKKREIIEITEQEKVEIDTINKEIKNNKEKNEEKQEHNRICEKCKATYYAKEEWKTLCITCYIESKKPIKENCKDRNTILKMEERIKQKVSKEDKEKLEQIIEEMIQTNILKCDYCSKICEFNTDFLYKLMDKEDCPYYKKIKRENQDHCYYNSTYSCVNECEYNKNKRIIEEVN